MNLKTIFEVIDPVKAQDNHDKIESLSDNHVCLTGEFDYGSKSSVEKLISDAGVINEKSVKKTLEYLVVGAQGSDEWKMGNYGGKIQKAMEWNAKGQNIKIIEEAEFITMVKSLING